MGKFLCRGIWLIFFVFFCCRSVQAGPVTDYVMLTDMCNYYTERLESQARKIEGDLAFVTSALDQFDNYDNRALKLRNAASRCQERIRTGEINVCTVTFKGSQISVDEALQRAAEFERKAQQCKKCAEQARKDKQVLENRLKEIGKLRADFQGWKSDNDAAVKDALYVIVDFAFNKFAGYLAGQVKSAATLQGWVTKYEKQFAASGVNVPIMQTKIKNVYDKLIIAQVNSATGRTLEKVEPFRLWELFKNETSSIALMEAELNTSVKESLSDPSVKKYLQEDEPAREAAMILLGKGLETVVDKPNLKRIVYSIESALKVSHAGKAVNLVPAVAITELVRDVGYNGLKWRFSLEALTVRYKLTEKSGNAVDSLHKLIERRKAAWSACL